MRPRNQKRGQISFAHADADITLFDRDAVAGRTWPGLQIHDVDEEVQRTGGGVPLQRGDAVYVLPLEARAVGAGFARVLDIRTQDTIDYDILETDDNVQLWTLTVILARRSVPIGVR